MNRLTTSMLSKQTIKYRLSYELLGFLMMGTLVVSGLIPEKLVMPFQFDTTFAYFSS